MKPRDRQLSTIRHEIPDRISVDAIHVENTEAVAAFLGIDEDDVLCHLGLDGRLVAPSAYYGDKPIQGEEFSEWGSDATLDYGTQHVYPLASANSKSEIERYLWPDSAKYNYDDAAATAAELCRQYAVRGPYWKPLFCQVCSLLGMEEAMVKMLRQPVLFESVLDRVFEYTYDFCQRFVDACGDSLDIFCLGDDFATQRGLMISPDAWRRFLKPRFAALFQIGKKASKPVWFHSCGDITAILPDLIDIGMDVWETVQLHTLPISPEQLKREYGQDITFFGGINTQRLPFTAPSDIKEEVIRRIQVLGRDGGYICGPDHHIKPDVSAENTVVLFETATSFRGKGYTSG